MDAPIIPDPEPAAPAARASRKAIWFGLILAVGVIGLFLLGKAGLLGTLDAYISELQSLAGTVWALPATVVLFMVAAFIGVPQFALIGAAVLPAFLLFAKLVRAFGPMQGALYSWVANMVSGGLTFWVGRFAGEKAVMRFSHQKLKPFIVFIARNAFAASAIVRNVPTGPFLMVNMLFGAVGAGFWAFMAGMGIGVIPKILLVTLAGQSLIAAAEGSPMIAILAALAATAIFAASWDVMRRRRLAGKNFAQVPVEPVDSDGPTAE